MDIHTLSWNSREGWKTVQKGTPATSQWVLYFGSRQALAESGAFAHLHKLAPAAALMGGSTGGEILGKEVLDDSVVAVCVTFKSTRVETFQVSLDDVKDSYTLGLKITEKLAGPRLRSIFLLMDGLNTNGTDLVRGIYEKLPEDVIVTGGLAGDGPHFKTTEVGLNTAPGTRMATAIGFYGDALRIGYGSVGGWDKFGPERPVTRAKGNVLYELGGTPALDLYKSYLGEEAEKLPGSGLLYPLSIRMPDADPASAVVRTMISIDEAEKSLSFAGDIPEGSFATLMRGNFDNLVEGAGQAASLASPKHQDVWKLAVLVSCIGRKLLLGQRISDETEAVAEALNNIPTLGFYSYGEICHHAFTQKCELHNQTMTITLLGEA